MNRFKKTIYQASETFNRYGILYSNGDFGEQIILMPANDKYDHIPVDPMKFKCVGKLVLKMERM